MSAITNKEACKAFFGMTHLNKNVLCAIDLITTGPNSSEDTPLEIAILPLNHMLKPHKDFFMFNMRMKPDKEVSLKDCGMSKDDLSKCILQGFDRYVVSDFLIDWVKNMNLPYGKKIVPLSWNWPNDSIFLRNWLTDSIFDEVFDWRFRDILSIANYINDRADCKNQEPIYPKLDFRYITNIHKIRSFQSRSATNNVLVLAETFRDMILNPSIN